LNGIHRFLQVECVRTDDTSWIGASRGGHQAPRQGMDSIGSQSLGRQGPQISSALPGRMLVLLFLHGRCAGVVANACNLYDVLLRILTENMAKSHTPARPFAAISPHTAQRLQECRQATAYDVVLARCELRMAWCELVEGPTSATFCSSGASRPSRSSRMSHLCPSVLSVLFRNPAPIQLYHLSYFGTYFRRTLVF